MTYQPFLVLCALLIAPSPRAMAQEGPESERAAPYVAVTIEVNGLEASASLLNEALEQLSATLRQVAATPDDLTPEQLAALTDLAEQTNALAVSLERTLNGLGPAIRDAEAPARDVLVGLIDTTKAQAIDPALRGIDRRIRTWLIVTILGALLVVGVAGLGLYLSTRQLRAMAGVLRSIGDDYAIVPRQALGETASGLAPATADTPRPAPGSPTE